MKDVLLVFLIIIGVSLITLILLQQKGSGVGAAFGGGSEVYRSQRGIEKIFHYLTVFFAFIYAVVSLILIFVK